MKEQVYFVSGMHCASCEILIERKLLEFPGVKSVEASVKEGKVLLVCEDIKPSLEKLNKLFKKEGYRFSEKPIEEKGGKEGNNLLLALVIAFWLIVGFLVLNQSGLPSLVSVNSTSTLPIFFVFGLIAGVSSCAALIGGLVLSMSKQWGDGSKPHLLFNTGRIISYGVFGAVLGAIGSRFQISPAFSAVLVIAVSLLMIVLGLQMLGIKAVKKFQFSLPKFITRYVADERNFQGRYMPFLMGAATFFLPCGFTITAQSLALLAGSVFQGGLIMLAFVLGTTPALLLIGFSSVKFSQKPHLAYQFSRVAGILVLFFALYNLNFQLNVLGIKSLSDLRSKTNRGLIPVAGGRQILKMEASAQGYQPNFFKVKAGIPVRWEITDVGTSGCTNAIISRGLFEGEIRLTPGQVSIKEFTPQKPGKYKFSCWMGMVTGTIEVVDKSGAVGAADNEPAAPSNGRKCGCCGEGR